MKCAAIAFQIGEKLTVCYITIDVEYDFGFTRSVGLASRKENFARSIACATPRGSAGIEYQLSVLDRYGLKAVFFVDPMPALIWGVAAIEDVVSPIIGRGHDVQLHIHTEWLSLAGSNNPLGKHVGNNIKDFALDDQCALINYAKNILMTAGAPAPLAFRAGSYGANDDTLRALALVGLHYDSSHCPGIASSLCEISLSPEHRGPTVHCGVIELPIGCIADNYNQLRHAQITALSAEEMIAALNHACINGIRNFTLVSHSFELMSRDRLKINKIVRHRFEKLCKNLSGMNSLTTGTFVSHPPCVTPQKEDTVILPFSPFRKVRRLVEQGISNFLYGSR